MAVVSGLRNVVCKECGGVWFMDVKVVALLKKDYEPGEEYKRDVSKQTLICVKCQKELVKDW